MKIQLNIYDFSIFFDALSIIFSYSIFVSLKMRRYCFLRWALGI